MKIKTFALLCPCGLISHFQHFAMSHVLKLEKCEMTCSCFLGYPLSKNIPNVSPIKVKRTARVVSSPCIYLLHRLHIPLFSAFWFPLWPLFSFPYFSSSFNLFPLSPLFSIALSSASPCLHSGSPFSLPPFLSLTISFKKALPFQLLFQSFFLSLPRQA